MKGGEGVIRSFGRSAMFCSPFVPRRQLHTTHLEMRRLTIEFTSVIQYWLPITLSVMPLPAWATFLWASRTMRPWTKHLFGKIIGSLKSSENDWDMLGLTPTWMIPSWSRKGYKILDFLISDFFILVNWRSSLQSSRPDHLKDLYFLWKGMALH